MTNLDFTELVEVAVRRRWDSYYQRSWVHCMDKRGTFFLWNWAAFFGGMWWLLYRRLYWLFFLDWVCIYLAASTSNMAFGLEMLLGRVGLGLFGTRLYFWNIHRVIYKLERARASMDVAKEVVRSKFQTLADWPM